MTYTQKIVPAIYTQNTIFGKSAISFIFRGYDIFHLRHEIVPGECIVKMVVSGLQFFFSFWSMSLSSFLHCQLVCSCAASTDNSGLVFCKIGSEPLIGDIGGPNDSRAAYIGHNYAGCSNHKASNSRKRCLHKLFDVIFIFDGNISLLHFLPC